ncbi:uncharacterized protein EI90DRAFT_2975212 [Cantharellus anzutake]|uniref:uncharacterized protein n=1 Tax=Cantharellus anzutake TaxID=1750568 RepID=UPI0019042F70|nr:uncharacterized protein EI90DRAFT_2975212 [Cantharellus anzutake]KAF8327210.1 hypothetical protein EI90DRAFT_2975212 [Cantharellus anzutake]
MPDISSASTMIASRPPFNSDSPPSIAMRGVGVTSDLAQVQRTLTSQQSKPSLTSSSTSDLGASADSQPGIGPSTTTVNDESEVPDGAIIDALKNAKERLFVLRIGEQMENLIQERAKPSFEISPSTSYQRMLVHRSAQYYKLSQETDVQTKAIVVGITSDSRIPSLRMAEIVPVENAPAPAFKIMRRSANDRPVPRKALSNSGEGESDDGQGSEAGSSIKSVGLAQRKKQHMTIAEREAAYNEARSRIFLSETPVASAASSSTQSLNSTPVTGDSTASVTSDDVGPATPSETFVPKGNQKKRHNPSKERRNESQRASPKTPYDVGDDSDFNRNAFTYPSLYEPSASVATPFDPLQYMGAAQAPPQANENGPVPMAYPSYPPFAGYPAPYMAHYPFYPYDPRQFPYHLPQPNSDAHNTAIPPPNAPQNGPSYPVYPPGGPWYPPPGQVMPPPLGVPVPTNTNSPRMGLPVPTGPSNPSQFPIYPPGQPYYFTPPPQQHGSPLTESPIQQHPTPSMMPPFTPPRDNGFQTRAQPMSRTSSRGSIQNSPGGVGSRLRLGTGSIGLGTAPLVRQPWIHSPGMSVPMRSDKRKGPSSGSRAGSVSSRSGSGGAMTPADETGSIASSETSSSSSRKTYTSTASSVHPLPPRPDWAIGLTPPRSHSSHSRNSSSSNSTSALQSISDFPPLPSGGIVQSVTTLAGSKASEPGVSNVVITAGVTPISKGVWKSPLVNRPLLLPSVQPDPTPMQQSLQSPQQHTQHSPHPSNGVSGAVHLGVGMTLPPLTFPPPNRTFNPGSVPNLPQPPINHSTAFRQFPGLHTRLDEHDGSFNRPPPKSVELFNPKGGNQPKRTPGATPPHPVTPPVTQPTPESCDGGKDSVVNVPVLNRGSVNTETEDRIRGEAVANAILVDKLADLEIGFDKDSNSTIGNDGKGTDRPLTFSSTSSLLEISNTEFPKDTISTVALAPPMAVAMSD